MRHEHDHHHEGHGFSARVRHAAGPHPHAHGRAADAALESSARGMRALRISLAVLAGAGGVAIGWRWADPAVGLLITVAILAVGWQAAREVGARLLDGVNPALTEKAEATLGATPGVLDVGPVRLRWVGRTLRAECVISVDPGSSVIQAHAVAVAAEHALIHAIPRLSAAVVHADPLDGADHHALLADHVAT